jgi:alpha-tubulin suppressor-like RCC1 family protein
MSEWYSWGLNKGGALALGDEKNRSTPQIIKSITNATDITGGASHTVFLTSNGDVFTCGANEYGECGLGNNVESVLTPKKIDAKSIIKTAASNNCGHTLLLDSAGKVYSFGSNTYGQLGYGNLTDSNTPQLIKALENVKITNIVAGGNGVDGYSLALAENGDLFAWGSNEFGQLGLDDSDKRMTPTKVDILSKITMMAAGSNHSFALRSNGQLFAFGRNDYGQLGLGDVEHRYAPEEVKSLRGKKITSIKAAGEYSLVLLEDSTLYVFGSNDEGQLGMGDKVQREVPTVFTGLKNKKITKLAAGWYHVLALTDSSELFVWGRNDDKQLGLGDKTEVMRSPAQVSIQGKIKDIAVGCFNSFALVESEAESFQEPGLTLEDLEKWAALLNEGKITAQVFQEKKTKILESM